MADRTHSPRPMGFVSSISDTNVQDDQQPKDHNPLHHAAHYLKNAVTLESSSDEKRRESVITDNHAHGGAEAEKDFWEKHGTRSGGDGKSGPGMSGERVENKIVGNGSAKNGAHADGHGKVQKMVDKVRPGNGVAREGGSMVG